MTTDRRPEEAGNVLTTMLQRMLRPLVRLLVSQQISYPLLSRLLKRLYVEVASTDFALSGKRVTVSRLSLLTGIHRRVRSSGSRRKGPRPTARPRARSPWARRSSRDGPALSLIHI